MALLNRQVILQYDVPGPDLWHERLVLAHICDEDYVVCTPDREVHYEQLPLLNEDLKLIRVKPSHNVLHQVLMPMKCTRCISSALPMWLPLDWKLNRFRQLRKLPEDLVMLRLHRQWEVALRFWLGLFIG